MAMLILMCISDPEGLKASRGERGLATSGERGQTVNLIHPGLLRLTELPGGWPGGWRVCSPGGKREDAGDWLSKVLSMA